MSVWIANISVILSSLIFREKKNKQEMIHRNEEDILQIITN